MALAVSNARLLKPEIRLAQAMSEYEAILDEGQKARFRAFRGQAPPNATDVMRLTAEIDKDENRRRRGGQCVGTRFTNVLQSVQQFSTTVDVVIGGAQNLLASGVWGIMKMSLQITCGSTAYFDKISALFMRIGRMSPRYKEFGLLYPKSASLQRLLCEWMISVIRLCTRAVLFSKKTMWDQFTSSMMNPFETEFGSLEHELEELANNIRDEVSLLSAQEQQEEVHENSKFRAFTMERWAKNSLRQTHKEKYRILDACSTYDHSRTWKQARKKGSSKWIFGRREYLEWKDPHVSSGTFWHTGIIGSGKTILTANVIENLTLSFDAATVCYFFCTHNEADSLKPRHIIGNLTRQLLESLDSEAFLNLEAMGKTELDLENLMEYLWKIRRLFSRPYFFILDGLDECEQRDAEITVNCLNRLLEIRGGVLKLFLSSRPEMLRWGNKIVKPQWCLSANEGISEAESEISDYITMELENRLESGRLCLVDPALILTIESELSKKARGMFLWVAFQLDTLCAEKTDLDILEALRNLPKDLDETFDRVLRKLNRAGGSDIGLCKKIFGIVAASKRPLSLEELREAVSVVPGNTDWTSGNLINDPMKLLNYCGTFLTLDEENLTVSFAHHSIMQHLCSICHDLHISGYHFDLSHADLQLGEICVTYLNFGIFDSQISRARVQQNLPKVNYPAMVVESTLPSSSMAAKLALKLLRSRREITTDAVHRHLENTRKETRIEPTVHHFLAYAKKFWLQHTRVIDATCDSFSLWKRMVTGMKDAIDLPFSTDITSQICEPLTWATCNNHGALFRYHLEEGRSEVFQSGESLLAVKEILLDPKWECQIPNRFLESAAILAFTYGILDLTCFLIRHGVDANKLCIPKLSERALYVATATHSYSVMHKLIRDGADVNAPCGIEYGSALQAAVYSLDANAIKILLDNGADPDIERPGKPLPLKYVCQAGLNAPGHELQVIALMLLKHGANPRDYTAINSLPLQQAEQKNPMISPMIKKFEQKYLQNRRLYSSPPSQYTPGVEGLRISQYFAVEDLYLSSENSE